MKPCLVLFFYLFAGTANGQFIAPFAFGNEIFQQISRSNTPYMIVKKAKPESYMLSRIDFIDDFAKRFNYQTVPSGQQIDDSLRRQFSRRACIESLFDQTDSRFNQSLGSDMHYRLAKEIMINEILDTEWFLPSIDSIMYGALDFTAWYGAKEVAGTIFLRKVKSMYGFQWKIISGLAPFLSIKPDPAYIASLSKDSTIYTMTANAQETNFLSLYGLMKNGIPLLKLTDESCRNNPVLITLSKAIQQKQCVLDQFQVSIFIPIYTKWVVRLNEFNRESDNSGWLIKDIYGELSTSKLPIPLRSYFPSIKPIEK